MSWRRILVIGANRTGKTLLLSSSVAGDYSRDYNPTTSSESFWDVKNKLELIDSPGFADSIINGDANLLGQYLEDSKKRRVSSGEGSSEPKPDARQKYREAYHSFAQDAVVTDLIRPQSQAPTTRDQTLLKGIDLLSIDAFLIVYGDDIPSQRTAKALRLVLQTHELPHLEGKKSVFLLRNFGELGRPTLEHPLPPTTYSGWLGDSSKIDEEKNDRAIFDYLFNDSVSVDTKQVSPPPNSRHVPEAHSLPAVSAISGEGVDVMWNSLKEQLSNGLGGFKGKKLAKGRGRKKQVEQRSACNLDSCSIS